MFGLGYGRPDALAATTEPGIEAIEMLALAINDALIKAARPERKRRGERPPRVRPAPTLCRKAGLAFLLCCRHQDLHQILSGQGSNSNAGPLRRIGAIHPL